MPPVFFSFNYNQERQTHPKDAQGSNCEARMFHVGLFTTLNEDAIAHPSDNTRRWHCLAAALPRRVRGYLQ